MYKKTHVFSILTLALTLGCVKHQTKESEKVIVLQNDSWGMEFKHTPISQASKEEQAMGKAVVYIDNIEGLGATGFFISPDGLLLTNEHVIEQDRCSKERCAGIRIIRHFTPNGDFEIFNRFKIIAQDKANDLTLIKVDLPEGTSVPYLQLDTETEAKDLFNRPLAILGHPFGSSLISSKASLDNYDGITLNLVSVAISGNSGSPLIDSTTSKVVGLYRASDWDKETIDKKTGNLKHYGEAKSIKLLVGLLRKQKILNETTIALNLESPSPSDTPLSPLSRSTLLEKMDTTTAYYGQAYGTDQESQGFDSVVTKLIKKTNAPALMYNFFSVLVSMDFKRGQKTTLTAEQAQRLTTTNPAPDYNEELKDLIGVYLSNSDRSACAKKYYKESNTASLRDITLYCRTLTNHEGRGILDELFEILNRFPSDKSLMESPYTMNRAFTIIYRQLGMMETLDDGLRTELLKVLERLARLNSNMDFSFNTEGLFTTLQHDPKLVLKGSFAETMRR